MDNLNPYASPLSIEIPRARLLVAGPLPWWKISIKWGAICAVSAAPSFFWGCGLHSHWYQIAAMLAGIGVFVVAYTMVEQSQLYQRVMGLKFARATLLAGYGTRLAISIIFPIGLFVDMLTGMVSVIIIEQGLFAGAARGGKNEMPFLAVFLTTLLQGTLLNVVLIAYMAMINVLIRFVSAIRAR